jgi:hypothetical protein
MIVSNSKSMKPTKDKGIEDYLELDLSYSSRKSNLFSKRGLDPSTFQEDPMSSMQNYRMDRLSSFAIMGIDFKITPNGQVKVIEVNGINSGMKGFAEAKVEYDGQHNSSIDEMRSMYPFDLDNELLWSFIKEEVDKRNPCDDALRSHLSKLGDAPLAYVAAKLQSSDKSSYRMEGASAVFGDKPDDDIYSLVKMFNRDKSLHHVHYGWERQYGEIADTLIGIEKILEDKRRADKLFEGQRDVKPESYEYTEEGYKRMMEEHDTQFVVIKPSDGARGEHLEIIDANTPAEERPQYSFGLVAEPFIPSKPIRSSQDGQDHDGCMRYVVVAEETKDGDIQIYHFGGYWRLSPNPLSDGLDIDAMRANLSQGALAEKVSDEDLALVRETVNRELPKFYRNLVAEANPRKSLERLMQEYLRLEQTG